MGRLDKKNKKAIKIYSNHKEERRICKSILAAYDVSKVSISNS